MNNLRILIALVVLSFIASCNSIKDEDVKVTKPLSEKKTVTEPTEKKQIVVQENIEGPIYDKSDPNWESKKKVDDLLKEIGISDWKDRKKAQQDLFEHVLSAPPAILDYLFIRSLQQTDPEISFRAKKVIEQFFSEKVYDPDRKKGFIGLQLMEPGRMIINKEEYEPIRVVVPQDGFPGKAAGIKEGDLILGVDGKICRRNFTMNDFILYIASLKPGTEIKLVLYSSNKIKPIKLKLAARPESANEIEPKKSKEELFKTWYKRKLAEIKEKKTSWEEE